MIYELILVYNLFIEVCGCVCVWGGGLWVYRVCGAVCGCLGPVWYAITPHFIIIPDTHLNLGK